VKEAMTKRQIGVEQAKQKLATMEVFQVKENKTTLTNNTKTHKPKFKKKKTILPNVKMCKAIAVQNF
jgi:hypothetical protein